MIRNLIEGTTTGISKDSTKKRFRVIQGLLSGQRVVDSRPCQLRVNSQYEVVSLDATIVSVFALGCLISNVFVYSSCLLLKDEKILVNRAMMDIW